MLTLDSSAVTALASARSSSRISQYRQAGLWPPKIPSAVLVECLTGHPQRDAAVNRLIKACHVEDLPEPVARRAALLRTLAQRGSAVDAIVVASAERHGGRVLTSDHKDLGPLAEETRNVLVEAI